MSKHMSPAKIFTRAATAIAAVIFSSVAAAQSTPTPPPTPPTPPIPVVSRPSNPLPPVEPTTPIAPLAPIPPVPPLPPIDLDLYVPRPFLLDYSRPAPTPRPDIHVNVDVDDFDIPDINVNVDMARFKLDMDRFNVDVDRITDIARTATDKAMRSFDVDRMADIARSATTSSIMNLDMDAVSRATATATSKAMTAVSRAITAPAWSTSAFDWQFAKIATIPAEGWASADPADSLYRIAREALNRGEYRRASQLFDQIAKSYPNSVYAGDARYWKAFALYRIGSADDLREALNTLQTGTGKYSHALDVDAPALATRINGALAARGDTRAIALVSHEASTGTSCDREDIAVRVEALNSLGQMDPASTTPMLKRLLERKDECSASLRRAALFLLARRGDPEAFALLTNAAKNDPDVRIRADAIRWLARIPGDQAVTTLEDIVRTSDNGELQQAAIEALANSDSPRARQSMRALIERTDLSESLRAEALSSLDRDHIDDGGAYLRAIYPKLETPRLQMSALRSIARIGGAENEQWMVSLVGNNSTSLDVRRAALGYAGRSTININELVKMYDSMADRPLREQLISLYSRRTEPEATDKLIDIAKNGTDPELRRLAISYLSRKNDPRTKQLLLQIIDK